MLVIINFILKMTQGTPLTAEEKDIIVKDIATGITQEAVTRKLDRHVRLFSVIWKILHQGKYRVTKVFRRR